MQKTRYYGAKTYPLTEQLRLTKSNPLLYPNGQMLVFAHPPIFSDQSYFDLVQIKRTTGSGGMVYGLTRETGPVVKRSSGAGLFVLTGVSTVNNDQGMIAALYYQSGSNLGGSICNANGALGSSISASGIASWAGGQTRNGTVQLVNAGYSYFLLIGSNDADNISYIYALNLDTGELRYDSSTGCLIGGGTGTYYIGAGNNANDGLVGLLCCSNGYLNPHQAKQLILTDPFSIFFPRERRLPRAFVTAAGGFQVAWARRSTTLINAGIG